MYSSKKNSIAQYFVTSIILELCLEAELRPVVWVARMWWYLVVL